MKTFVSLAIVLARERFTADRANERSLVCMCAKMRTKIVCSGETLRTQIALEGGRMLLLPAAIRAIGGRTLRIGEIKNVIALI